MVLCLWISVSKHSNKGCIFENEILEHLYSMENIKQSMTMPYSPHGNILL